MIVKIPFKCFSLILLNLVWLDYCYSFPKSSLEDIPEEILRTEIIVEGRSPVDNQPLSASEYAQMQQRHRQSPYPPTINPNLQGKIFWLHVLKMIRLITPW